MIDVLITHCMACHSNKRAPQGCCHRNHVINNAFILWVGDIRNTENVPYSIGQPLQTATGLLCFGHQRCQWGPL